MRWINPGRAARDETAFHHELKTAHRLRAGWERLRRSSTPTSAPTTSPSVKVQTTEHLRYARCGIARPWPGMCAVTSPRTRPTSAEHRVRNTPPPVSVRPWPPWVAGAARKAAQRWKTDPGGEYTQSQRKNLQDANKKKRAGETTPGHKSWRSHHRFSIRPAGFLRGKNHPGVKRFEEHRSLPCRCT